jgi:hypothetical protein
VGKRHRCLPSCSLRLSRICSNRMMFPLPDERTSKPRLFAQNYRAGDASLFVTLICSVAFLYLSVRRNIPFAWPHALVLGAISIALLGLLRVRIAFALLSVPFFLWAGYSVVRWLFFPPKWTDLFDPFYDLKWSVSILFEYLMGEYFWKKFSNTNILDSLFGLFERSRQEPHA